MFIGTVALLFSVVQLITPQSGDATPAFLDAVEKVRAAGGGTVEFAKGEYVFSTKSATDLSFKISNHNQSDPHKVALPLVGLTNVTVRGNGSTLLVDGAAIGFTVLDSSNVRIENLRLDWTRSFISDAVIEGFQDGKTRVDVDPVKFPHVYSNGCFYATGTDWTNYVRYLVVCRADTHEIVGGTGDILWKGKPMEKVGPSSYLMDMDFSKLGAGARVGDVIAFRSPQRTCPGSVVYRSADTVYEDVSIHSCWGMGVICQFSENFTWRGTGRPEDRRSGVFARAETGRFFSANADASHFSNCRGRIVEENCLFEGMMDDAINVHATSVRIVEKLASDTIRCRFMHDDAYDFELFRPGDRLRFIHPKTMVNGPSMKIVSFRLEGDGHDMTIVTKYPIPADFGVGDAVENAESMADVVFRGNVVARNRARGALFTTTGSVLIESNVFERVAGQALLFEGDASHWYESGSLRDCVIRGNVFRECNGWWPKPSQAVISFHPSYDDTDAPGKPYHRGIAVVDNTFATYRQPLVYARATENLIFSGNKVSFTGRLPWGEPRPELVVTEGRCRNIKVDDGTSEPMLWGLLLHLGTNMWWDEPRDAENPVDRNWTDCAKDTLLFDEGVWREATDRMAKGGLNCLIIDIGDGMAFPSHPEIAIKGSWAPERLKAEVARLRAMGIEAVPKLNFSACHDVWMKKYARMLSTPEYYRFCADVIKDVFDVFGKPRFFHIGFDEENDHPFQSYVVIRRGDLWWHDLNFLVAEVEKGGARAWIWSDAAWNHPKEFYSRMSPNVLQSNWYYYPSFDIAAMKAAKSSHAVAPETYLTLERHGFDQVPTGSNWDNPSNMVNTVRFCRGRIGPSRLKGFLQTPWKMTTPKDRERILASIDQLVEAKKIWEEGK